MPDAFDRVPATSPGDAFDRVPAVSTRDAFDRVPATAVEAAPAGEPGGLIPGLGEISGEPSGAAGHVAAAIPAVLMARALRATGTKVEGISPEQINQLADLDIGLPPSTSPPPLKAAARTGAIETALNFGSQAVALPAAGLAGLGALLGPGGPSLEPANRAIESVADTLTYQPRTELGRQGVEIMSTPFRKLAGAGEKVGEALRSTTAPYIGETTAAAAGTVVSTAIQSAPMLVVPLAKAVAGNVLALRLYREYLRDAPKGKAALPGLDEIVRQERAGAPKVSPAPESVAPPDAFDRVPAQPPGEMAPPIAVRGPIGPVESPVSPEIAPEVRNPTAPEPPGSTIVPPEVVRPQPAEIAPGALPGVEPRPVSPVIEPATAAEVQPPVGTVAAILRRGRRIKPVEATQTAALNEPVARTNYGGSEYEWSIGRDGEYYQVQVRGVGGKSEWESAHLGRQANPFSAREKLAQQLDSDELRGNRSEISDPDTRQAFEKTQQARLRQEAESAAAERARRDAEELASREYAGHRAELEERFKQTKFKQATATVPLVNSKMGEAKTAEVKGPSIGGLIVHRNDQIPGGGGKGYRATHILSGKSAGIQADSLADAKVAAWRLSQVLDFTQPESVVMKQAKDSPGMADKLALIRSDVWAPWPEPPQAKPARVSRKTKPPAEVPAGAPTLNAMLKDRRGSLGQMFQGDPLEQLSEKLQGEKPGKKLGIFDQFARSATRGRDAVEQSLAAMHSAAAWTWNRYRRPPTYTNYDAAYGDFHLAETYARRRQMNFAETSQRAIPNPLRQEAAANAAMAEGDPAKLATWARELRVQASNLRAIADGTASLEITADWYGRRNNAGFQPGATLPLERMSLRRMARGMDRSAASYDSAATLDPTELRTAKSTRDYWDAQLQRAIDYGWLKEGVRNYVGRLWKNPGTRFNHFITDMLPGRLGTNPSFLKQRVFEEKIQGELLGMQTQTNHLGTLTVAYDRSFNRAVNARAFVESLFEAKASDGKRLVGASTATARIVVDEKNGVRVLDPGEELLPEAKNPRVLVKQRMTPEEMGDYVPINHPAFKNWSFAGKDTAGNPVVYRGDALVHPEAARQLRAVLESSRFAQHPVTRTLLRVNAELKGTTLAVSGFHQVQEGVHAFGHMVDPTGVFKNLPKIEEALANPTIQRGIRTGLEMGSGNAIEIFAEGSQQPGLLRFVPGVGPALQHYQGYLFGEYIPRIKARMYLDALERNTKRFGKELRPEQIESLTADQANAAFGEQNYGKLGRHPTTQAILRLAVFAPDFLEARARFAGQALRPYGAEQRWALGRLIVSQYVGARILNQVSTGDPHWDMKDAFKVIVGNDSLELRSVPGDVLSMYENWRGFMSHRISSIARPALEFALRRDSLNRPVTSAEILANVARNATPITLQSLVNQQDRPVSESVLTGMGISTKPYRTTATETARRIFFSRLGAQTPLERSRSRDRSQLARRLQEGRATMEEIERLANEGEIAPADVANLAKRQGRGTSELVQMSKQLDVENLLQVWQDATPAEREALKPLLERKRAQLPKNWNPSVATKLSDLARDALRESP